MKINNQGVLIIAEIANAFEGDIAKAQELVIAAADAGVDAVKFQIFTAEELLVKSHPKHNHFKDFELSIDNWRVLRGLTESKKLKFFCDVFGLNSFEFSNDLGVDGIKIHSSDIANIPLLREISKCDKSILLSCGGANELDIYQALKILRPFDRDKRIVLMYGFQNFPTSEDETNLRRLKTLSENFSLPVGFMDHIDAEKDLAHTLPLLAIAAGASIIEKHITLDRSAKGIDYYSSLEPKEMHALVKRIRDIETILGKSEVVFGKEELLYRKKMKKHLVASASIANGQIITDKDITFKRAESSIYSVQYNDIIGKKTTNSFVADEPLLFTKLAMKVGILIIARLNSRRLSRKALLPVMGRPVLSYLIERAKLCKKAHEIILCTGDEVNNAELVNLAKKEGIKYFCGDEEDVVSRMCGACEREKIDAAVRLTGDDIFFSHEFGDLAIECLLKNNADYCHNKGLISGSECEVFLFSALKTIYNFAEDRKNTEYLTYYLENENFQKIELSVPDHLRRDISLTLDTPDDLDKVRDVLENIYKKDKPFTQKELTDFIDKYPEKFPVRTRDEKANHAFKKSINCKLTFKMGNNI